MSIEPLGLAKYFAGGSVKWLTVTCGLEAYCASYQSLDGKAMAVTVPLPVKLQFAARTADILPDKVKVKSHPCS